VAATKKLAHIQKNPKLHKTGAMGGVRAERITGMDITLRPANKK
jgi:hypothetical protein